MNRVVVTGMGAICPLGNDWSVVEKKIREKKNGIRIIPEWDAINGLLTRLAAPVDFEIPEHYSRKKTRGMARVALMATRVSELALLDAGLLDDPEIQNGSMGVAYGSSSGGTEATGKMVGIRTNNSLKGISSTTYIEMMSHTNAVNVSLFFGMKGRIIPTSTACTSGSLGIGYAYEAIKCGHQSMMVAGGSEELDVTEAAVFDVMFATSTKNDKPESTPSPFDKDRDGLVVGEGACTLILEDLEHAKLRGAKIYAEIVGFGTNSDGVHLTNPCHETMKIAMELSLKNANLKPEDINYVNAHATGTTLGDIAESTATNNLFGKNVYINSMKSYVGHTLGASGSLEAWFSINMMNNNWYAPTLNLKNVDRRCLDLNYIIGNGVELDLEFVMSNNFAFGGINTSLIFKRWN